MTDGKGLGLKLLGLAHRLAPPARRDAVLAMWSEFEHCERGRTRWALGCVGAALRWRVVADGGYAAALILAPIAMSIVNLFGFMAVFGGRNMPLGTFEALMQGTTLIVALVTAFGLGRYRPAAAMASATIGMIVWWNWASLATSIAMGSMRPLWFASSFFTTWYVLQIAMHAAVWFGGAALGARSAPRHAL